MTHRVVARNNATRSSNRIHSDEVARRLGFRAGLVPGVTGYAYMSRPLVDRWGRAWLDRGRFEVRLLKPVYEGDPNNVIGSVNLINASVKDDVKCFVYTSSIAGAGAAQLPMREDMVPQPEEPYGISKYAVGPHLRAAHRQFALNYWTFRPHNV